MLLIAVEYIVHGDILLITTGLPTDIQLQHYTQEDPAGGAVTPTHTAPQVYFS